MRKKKTSIALIISLVSSSILSGSIFSSCSSKKPAPILTEYEVQGSYWGDPIWYTSELELDWKNMEILSTDMNEENVCLLAKKDKEYAVCLKSLSEQDTKVKTIVVSTENSPTKAIVSHSGFICLNYYFDSKMDVQYDLVRYDFEGKVLESVQLDSALANEEILGLEEKSSGELVVFQTNQIAIVGKDGKLVHAEKTKRNFLAMTVLKDDRIVLIEGKEDDSRKELEVYSSDLKTKEKSIELTEEGGYFSLQYLQYCGKLLVGALNHIFEVDPQTGEISQFSNVSQSVGVQMSESAVEEPSGSIQMLGICSSMGLSSEGLFKLKYIPLDEQRQKVVVGILDAHMEGGSLDMILDNLNYLQNKYQYVLRDYFDMATSQLDTESYDQINRKALTLMNADLQSGNAPDVVCFQFEDLQHTFINEGLLYNIQELDSLNWNENDFLPVSLTSDCILNPWIKIQVSATKGEKIIPPEKSTQIIVPETVDEEKIYQENIVQQLIQTVLFTEKDPETEKEKICSILSYFEGSENPSQLKQQVESMMEVDSFDDYLVSMIGHRSFLHMEGIELGEYFSPSNSQNTKTVLYSPIISFGVMRNSNQKDGCEYLMKMLLSETFQVCGIGNPVRNDVMNRCRYSSSNGYAIDIQMAKEEYTNLLQSPLYRIYDYTPLTLLIDEEINLFELNKQDAATTAKNIENRAGLILSEMEWRKE